MKKVLFTALLSIIGLTAFAQHETLFGRARVVGGFGGPIMEWGLGNDLNTSVGGGGGVVIDNFFLGGYGHVWSDRAGIHHFLRARLLHQFPYGLTALTVSGV